MVGAWPTIGNGDTLNNPSAPAMDRRGRIYLTDRSSLNLYRIDPASGNRTVVATLPSHADGGTYTLGNPLVDSNGQVLVPGEREIFFGGPSYSTRIYRVNPANGNFVQLTSTPISGWFTGFSLQRGGKFVATRPGRVTGEPPVNTGNRDLATLEMANGNLTSLTGPVFSATALGMVRENQQSALVLQGSLSTFFVGLPWNFGANELKRVNLQTGSVTTIDLTGEPLFTFTSLGTGAGNQTYISASSLIYDVNPATGSTSLLSGLLDNFFSIKARGIGEHLYFPKLGQLPDRYLQSDHRPVPAGNPGLLDFSEHGLQIQMLSLAQEDVLSVERMPWAPENLANAAGVTWALAEPESAFSAHLTFEYTPADVAGLNTNALRLFKSSDLGQTWTKVPSFVDTVQRKVTTLQPQSSFSLWALADDDVTGVEEWNYFE